MARALASCVILPSSLTNRNFSLRRASPIKSKKDVNWDTTRLLIEGFLFLMTTSAFNNASSWKKKKGVKKNKISFVNVTWGLQYNYKPLTSPTLELFFSTVVISPFGFSVSDDFFIVFSGTLIKSFSLTGALHNGQLGAIFSDDILSIMHCRQKACAQRVMTGSTSESKQTGHSSSTPDDKATKRSAMCSWESWSVSRFTPRA